MMRANNIRIQSIVPVEFRRILTVIMFLGLMGLILIPAPSQILASNPSYQEPDLLFQQANEHYQQGRYEQAALIYQGLIVHGYQSGNLYYNLGNTYLKLGQKGQAVLYYEKARRLIPGDSDLNTSLESVLTEVKDGAPNWFGKTYSALLFLAPLNLLTIAASALLFLFILLLCLAMLLPGLKNKTTGKVKRGFFSLTLVTGILLFCLISMTAMTYFDQTQKQAVIVKSAVNAYYEPKVSETISFALDEGSRIYLLETKDDWTRIKRRDGKWGWIKGGGYEEI